MNIFPVGLCKNKTRLMPPPGRKPKTGCKNKLQNNKSRRRKRLNMVVFKFSAANSRVTFARNAHMSSV